jgi:hypothetical protein
MRVKPALGSAHASHRCPARPPWCLGGWRVARSALAVASLSVQVDPACCVVHAAAVAGKHRGPDWTRLCQATKRAYDLFDSDRLTIEELNTLEAEAALACEDCRECHEQSLYYRAVLDPRKRPQV